MTSSWCTPTFYAKEGHETILSGDKKQSISIEEGDASFGKLIIDNTSAEGVEFKNYLKVSQLHTKETPIVLNNCQVQGWTLDEDVTIKGDFNLNSGTLNLNGHQMIIESNFSQVGGEVRFNEGKMEVAGNCSITGGNLKMESDNDYMLVKGDYYVSCYWANVVVLEKGVLELKGDFQVTNSWCTPTFYATIPHQTILTGDEVQIIQINEDNSQFGQLILKNKSEQGVSFNTYVKYEKLVNENSTIGYENGKTSGWTLDRDTIINGDINLAAGDLDLNGYELWVKGSFNQTGGNTTISDGQLIIDGNYTFTAGTFNMLNEKDYVLIKKNVWISNYYSKLINLKNGILEIQGDYEVTSSWCTPTVYCTDKHRTILSGNAIQKVTLGEVDSIFNQLFLTKKIDTGYTFNLAKVANSITKKEDDLEAPTQVQDVSCEMIDENTVKLSWGASTDNNEVLGYEIFRDGRSIGFTRRTTFEDRGISSSGKYIYTLIAYDLVKNASTSSEPLSIVTAADGQAPSTPQNLMILNQNTAQVTLRWESSTDNVTVSGYRIYRDDKLVGEVNGKTVRFIDQVEEGGLYRYTVSSFDNDGNESYRSKAVIYDNMGPTITQVRVVAVDNTEVTFEWDKSEDNYAFGGYTIYRNGEQLIDVTATRYTDTKLEANKAYTYQIIAYDKAGNTAEASNLLEVYTSLDIQPPSKPDHLGLKSKTTQAIIFNWEPSVDNISVAYYQIYRDGELVGRSDTALYIDNAIKADTNYTYQIEAIDSSGNKSELSEQLAVTASTIQLVQVTPDQGATIGGEKGQKLEIVCINDKNIEDGYAKFEVSLDGVNWEVLATDVQVSRFNEDYKWFTYEWQIKELLSNNYQIRYTVYNNVGHNAEMIARYSVDRTAPQSPHNLVGKADETSVVLSFDNNIEKDVIAYQIYRSEDNQTFQVIGKIPASSTLQFRDTSVLNSKPYYYKVTAIDQFEQQSEYSEVITAGINLEGKPQINVISPMENTISSETVFEVEGIDNDGIKTLAMYYWDVAGEEWKSFANNSSLTRLSGHLEMPNKQTAIKIKYEVEDILGNKNELISSYQIVHNTLVLKNITIGDGTAKIDWEGTNTSRLGHYIVEIIDRETGAAVCNEELDLTQRSFTKTNLEPEKNYQVTIYKYNNNNEVQLTSISQIFFMNKVDAIGGVSVFGPYQGAYNEAIPIQFSLYHNKGLKAVILEKSRDKINWSEIITYSILGAPKAYTGSYSMTLEDEAEGTIYIRARVVGADLVAMGDDKCPILINEIDKTPPPALEKLEVKEENGTLVLNWLKPQSMNDIVGYKIERRAKNEASYTNIATRPPNEESLIDYLVDPGETYEYRIYTIDKAGNLSKEAIYATHQVMADVTPPTIVSTSWDNKIDLKKALSIYAKDDFYLAQINIEVKDEGRENFILLTSQSFNKVASASTYFNIDTRTLRQGIATFRITAIDIRGNKSVERLYDIYIDRTPPSDVAFKATTVENGVEVWFDCEEEGATYKVYRYTGNKRQLLYYGENNTYIDNALTPQKQYTYGVVAIDAQGNEGKEKQILTTYDVPDTQAPKAELVNLNQAIVGETYYLDASTSTDNCGIKSYRWYINDKLIGEKSTVSYLFDKKAIYEVKLEVEDYAGNVTKKVIEVEPLPKEAVAKLIIDVRNSYDSSVCDANIYIASNTVNTENLFYKTSFGKLEVNLIPDNYSIAAFAGEKGEAGESVYLEAGETKTIVLDVKKEGITKGDVIITPLDIKEIKDLGIDTKDPDNLQIFEVAINFEFEQKEHEGVVEKETHTVFVNSSGQMYTGSGGKGAYYAFSGGGSNYYVYATPPSGGGSSGEVPTIYVLKVPMEIQCLKEFFEVRLEIINQSVPEISLDEITAKLNLPDGLSLAPTKEEQSFEKELEDLAGGQQSEAVWYVRGDKEGDYTLDVIVNGILEPFGLPQHLTFKNASPLKVWGSSALYMYVEAPEKAISGEDYVIDIELTNVSDKPVYDMMLTPGDIESYKQVGEEIVATYDSPVYEITYENAEELNVLELGEQVKIKEFYPNQTLKFQYTTQITFPEENDEGFEAEYLLKKLFVTGLNTTINKKVTLLPVKQSNSRLRDASCQEAVTDEGIDIVTGAQLLNQTLLAVNGSNSLNFGIEYNSKQTKKSALGQGWSHTFDSYVQKKSATEVIIYWRPGQGTIYTYDETEKAYLADDWQTTRDKLTINKEGDYVLERSDFQVHTYNKQGRLVEMKNKIGQVLSLDYNEDGQVCLITDQSIGESIILDYSNKKLTTVSDTKGRHVSLRYNNEGLLEAITNAIGNTTTFTYNNKGLIESGINAEGYTFVKIGYDKSKRVISQTYPEGYTEKYAYEKKKEGDLTYIILKTTDDVGNTSYRTVDQDGQLVKEVDALGNTYYFTYNENHRKIGATDGNGHTSRFEYNDYGDTTKVIDALGNTTIYTYDDRRNLLTTTDAKGNVTANTYRADNQLMTTTLPTGAITSYVYDGNGFLQAMTKEDYYEGKAVNAVYDREAGLIKSTRDYKGNTTTVTYDSYGYPRTTTDREGKVTTYIYNAVGQLLSTIDQAGNKVSYEYDKRGLLLKQKDSKGIISYEYDKWGNKVKEIDPRGNVTEYFYTIKGQPKYTKYADGTTEQMTYNANNQVKTILDRNNGMTSYRYDAAGNVSEVTTPQTGTTSYTYDDANHVRTQTDGNNHTYTYYYDALGQLEKTVDPKRYVTSQNYDVLGNVLTATNGALETTSYTYDKWGRQRTITDAKGNVTSYTYDTLDNLETVTDALGGITRYTYDNENRVLTVTNPLGYVKKMKYNDIGKIELATDEEGRTTRTLYDERGNVKSVYDGFNVLVQQNVYDEASNLKTTTNGLGYTTTYEYDNMNRLFKSIDAMNQIKQREYDNRGNLIKVVDPPTADRLLPVTTSATYNPKGQVESITDPENNVQSYKYDVVGNLIQETTPIRTMYTYTYNDVNLLETVTNPRGQLATYKYDGAGRVVYLQDEVDTTNYIYDKNGNLEKVIAAKAGTITRTFDALNRVKTYMDVNGNIIKYDYDAVGNLKQITYPGGQVLTYYYDHSGLLTDVIDFNGGKTHYQYDLNGKLRTITRPNGTTREMTYDDAYQVKSIIEKASSGKIIINYSFDYDAGGKIKEEEGVNVATTQITNGETVMTYGKGNKLLTYNGIEVKYDASGNMIYGPLDGKMVDFKYDARNRLIEAGGTTYQYDAENNRIGQITNGKQTTYVVDTTSSQLSRVIEEKKGDTVRQYIYGLGLIMQVEGGEYATYHFDNRGSTVAITNKSGSTIASYTYGPYGELLNKTGKVTTSFLYNGKYGVETDANGLYYMRARYYNPEIKRFINQDVVQGSLDNAITLNRFAYANGNPISGIDPFGLYTGIPDEAKTMMRKAGVPPEEYLAEQLTPRYVYTQEQYELDMQAYKLDNWLTQTTLYLMTPFIAAESICRGIGESAGFAMAYPDEVIPTLWRGITNSDPSQNIITAPVYGVYTQTGPLLSGELSPEDFVKYQVNLFSTAAGAYGTARTVSNIGSKLGRLKKGVVSRGAGNSANLQSGQKLAKVNTTRINLANGRTRFTPLRANGNPVSAGMQHVIDGHFNRPLGNSRSIFSIEINYLKEILQSNRVVSSTVIDMGGGQYKRIVDTGEIIGNTALKFGGNTTSYIEVITDVKGNLITTYPVPAP